VRRATGDDEDLVQRERAEGRWVLVIREARLSREQLGHVRRVLRVHRSELAGFLARLPGEVRRGARVDLLPLVEALRAGGVGADLVRRDPV
jgi:hypothetical protein